MASLDQMPPFKFSASRLVHFAVQDTAAAGIVGGEPLRKGGVVC